MQPALASGACEPLSYCSMNASRRGSSTESSRSWRAQAVADAGESEAPGTVVAVGQDGIGVACGQGRLAITELQRAGGKRLDSAGFLRGFPLAPGQRFD